MPTATRVRARKAAGPLVGVTEPRLGTPPKRELTPETSRGFACIAWAVLMGIRLYPWQKLALIRALELNPDGTYRFRVVLILVARQNGKTTLCKVLTLWRMVEDGARLVVGTSTNMEYAREAWAATVDIAEGRDLRLARMRAHTRLVVDLPDEDEDVVKAFLPRRERLVASVKRGALDTSLTLVQPAPGVKGARYKIASASRTGGRSLSLDLGLADELREHRQKGEQDTGWEAWAALDGATTARPNSQIWGLSNAGDDGSVVLNTLRSSAIEFIEDGEGDDTLCLLEWSGEDDCDVWDRAQWAQANPALGYGGITEATLASKANLPSTVFRPEHLCQGVPALRAAILPAQWAACLDRAATLDRLRNRVALCWDVSPEFDHVALVAAAVDDQGFTRLDVLGAWGSIDEAFTEKNPNGKLSIPEWARKIRPKKFGWFPTGPAAAAAPQMKALARKIRGIEPMMGEGMSQACQGLTQQAKAGKLRHSGDPMLSAHVLGANKQISGDGFRFVRRGAAPVSAAYAGGGAVLLARSIPRPKRQGMVTAA
jgi:hypothetical protein